MSAWARTCLCACERAFGNLYAWTLSFDKSCLFWQEISRGRGGEGGRRGREREGDRGLLARVRLWGLIAGVTMRVLTRDRWGCRPCAEDWARRVSFTLNRNDQNKGLNPTPQTLRLKPKTYVRKQAKGRRGRGKQEAESWGWDRGSEEEGGGGGEEESWGWGAYHVTGTESLHPKP